MQPFIHINYKINTCQALLNACPLIGQSSWNVGINLIAQVLDITGLDIMGPDIMD